MMLHYFKEAKEGDALAVACHLLEHDDKRMRVWLEMTAPGGERLAASEQLLISVAQGEGGARAAPWGHETKAALDALARAQSGLAAPVRRGGGDCAQAQGGRQINAVIVLLSASPGRWKFYPSGRKNLPSPGKENPSEWEGKSKFFLSSNRYLSMT